MIRTRGLSNVHLPVHDLRPAIRFYSELFGYEVVTRDDERVVLQTPVGRGEVVLVPFPDSGRLPLVRFGLELDDAADRDAAVDSAVELGGSVVEQTEHQLGGSSTVIADPAGHQIIL